MFAPTFAPHTLPEISCQRLTPRAARKTVVAFYENKAKPTAAALQLPEETQKVVRTALRNSRFEGQAGQMQTVTVGTDGIDAVVAVGLNRLSSTDRATWFTTGIKIAKHLDAMGVREASLALGEEGGSTDLQNAAEALLEGIAAGLYRFDVYKTEQKDHQKPVFQKLNLLTNTRTARLVEEGLDRLHALYSGQSLTRDLVILPPNTANPQYVVNEAKKLAKLGVKVDVLDEKELTKLGMELFMAVGGGASEADQPRMIIMTYTGADKSVPHRAIVGKGLMFDTGGYNLKPTGFISGMKADMGGAAVVMGVMRALAESKAKVNVIGVCGCAMNMISDRAMLPDAIYKSYKGLTVEIGNTDAEGRLVLADCIAYTVEKFEPVELIDLATLTGACMVALGGSYAGLFSTTDRLANALQKSGDKMGEKLWRLPVDDVYAATPKVADLNNDGSRYGGASTAAVFLKKFVGKTPWAHLDIAGVSLTEKGVPGMLPVTGATGFGVRLLLDYLTTESASENAEAPRRRGRPAGSGRRGPGRPPKAAAAPAVTSGRRGRPRKTA